MFVGHVNGSAGAACHRNWVSFRRAALLARSVAGWLLTGRSAHSSHCPNNNSKNNNKNNDNNRHRHGELRRRLRAQAQQTADAALRCSLSQVPSPLAIG